MIVFAYASLVNAASAAETLGREVDPEPATLDGHRRAWSVARSNETSEKVFELAGTGERPGWFLGLNLERDPAGRCNGALIEVTDAELDRLALRELRYRPVALGVGAIVDRADVEAVAFIARDEHHHPEPPARAMIARAYVATVEAAFTRLGADQLERYRESTDPPPVPVADVVLVEDRIPPGNPRAW